MLNSTHLKTNLCNVTNNLRSCKLIIIKRIEPRSHDLEGFRILYATFDVKNALQIDLQQKSTMTIRALIRVQSYNKGT